MDQWWLQELINYDPDTGELTWTGHIANRGRHSMEVGYIGAKGYRLVHLDGKCYRAARLIWLWMTGKWPKHTIDHINRIRDDDRWCNLRDVTMVKNRQNRSCNRGRTGLTGVYHSGTRFRANICVGTINYNLGQFDTAEEAAEYREFIYDDFRKAIQGYGALNFRVG